MSNNTTITSTCVKFNDQMNLAVAITPKFSATLSMLGVSVIIFRFFRLKPAARNTYQRLLVAMSFMNFFGSLGFFIGQWSFPTPITAPPGSLCIWQGWDLQINSAVFWYNGCLATNFLLRIKYEYHEHDVLRLEPAFHLVAWLYPVVTSFIALGFGMYGPAGPWCWITTSFDWARWAFFYVGLWTIMIYTTIVMIVIAKKVQESDRRTRANLSLGGGTGNAKSRRYSKTREVSLQAIFYVLSFLLTWVFGTANRIQNAIDPTCPIFALVWLHSLFVPLQGFFNFLVYLFPRYMTARRERREKREKLIKERKESGFPEDSDRQVCDCSQQACKERCDFNLLFIAKIMFGVESKSEFSKQSKSNDTDDFEDAEDETAAAKESPGNNNNGNDIQNNNNNTTMENNNTTTGATTNATGNNIDNATNTTTTSGDTNTNNSVIKANDVLANV
jgi:hypothetical protein